jgi:riboflavin synthase
MFTGIIEQLAVVKAVEQENDNLHITLEAPFTNELKIDQSVAHNGICLTVVNIENQAYTVTAIQETVNKTNIGAWTVGTKVNVFTIIVVELL